MEIWNRKKEGREKAKIPGRFEPMISRLVGWRYHHCTTTYALQTTILLLNKDVSTQQFSSVFYFLYMAFTVITGTFMKDENSDFPDYLSVVYGCVATLQVCIQMAFINNLKQKVCSKNGGTLSFLQRSEGLALLGLKWLTMS